MKNQLALSLLIVSLSLLIAYQCDSFIPKKVNYQIQENSLKSEFWVSFNFTIEQDSISDQLLKLDGVKDIFFPVGGNQFSIRVHPEHSEQIKEDITAILDIYLQQFSEIQNL